MKTMHKSQCAQEIIIGLTVFLVTFMNVYLSRYQRLTSEISVQAERAILYLPESGQISDLITDLYEQGIHFDKNELLWAANLLNWKSYRAGRYEINGSYSYNRFLSKLGRGEQDPFLVRVQAGQNHDSFTLRTSLQFRFSQEELDAAMKDSSMLRQHNIEEHHLLGRMLPNSYEMYWTATPQQFLARMLREFDTAVTRPYGERAAELGISIDEAVILASIIEWEVRHVDEKRKVSGLYWNRLNRRMRLQADPTVAHAIGERRRLLFADYRVDHPYNTYRIFGLPPGPINNPRLTSITAALYPEQHNYIYMVASGDGSGYHVFTTNYADHRRESRRWTNWLREQRRIRDLEAQQEQTTGTNSR